MEKNYKYSIVDITENGIETNIIFDLENNLYVVDNKVYNEEDYFSDLKEQSQAISNEELQREELAFVNFLEDKHFEINPKVYTLSGETDVQDNHSTAPFCVSCGHNPMYVPSSGYLSYGNTIRKDIRFVLSASAVSAATIVAKLPTTGVPLATVTKWVTTFLLGVVSTYPNEEGSSVNLNYLQEHAYHSTCPKAVRERRTFKVYDETQQYVYEFYSSNPF